MPKVKVYNDNKNVPVWKETFKGDPISINYGEPIEMDFFDANEFKGQYFQRKNLADNTQDPKTFKMIRIEKIDPKLVHTELDKSKAHKCFVCAAPFATEKQLMEHGVQAHQDVLIPETDEEIEARVQEQTQKRKPGRPAKVQAQETAE